MDPTWRRRLARSLSVVENREAGWREILAKSHPHRLDMLAIGVTGPPGAGKSTLIDALAATLAGRGQRVGVLAIDPASPFSGGAVLGDRMRMRRCEDLDDVFVRSMSARGHAGGLNESAVDLCAVMAGHGVTRLLLETVGVGQNEVEVAFVADCTLVVSVPGLGDSVQASKAGLTEVGDIYVVNKGDRPGADHVARDLVAMLSLVFPGQPGRSTGRAGPTAASVPGATRDLLTARYGDPDQPGGAWHPPVLTVTAVDGGGVDALADMIEDFGAWLAEGGRKSQRQIAQAQAHLLAILRRRLLERHLGRDGVSGSSLAALVSRIARGEIDPHAAAEAMLGGTAHEP